MNTITLLEWAKDPVNRIKLMEDILFEFQTEEARRHPTWQFCCPTINELLINNKDYSHIDRCKILASYGESPGPKAYVYLFDILPELVPDKDRDYDSVSVWFRTYTTRCKALESAIADIKLKFNL